MSSKLSPFSVKMEPGLLHQIDKLNQTEAGFPLQRCCYEFFEAQVQRTPKALAVICEGEYLTYEALNQRANKLARFLIDQGVGPSAIVSILAERSIDFLTAILAVFKAGGAYLPLDPLSPPQRLCKVLEQSGSRLILATENHLPLLAQALDAFLDDVCPQSFLIEESLRLDYPQENISPRSTPDDLAYIIFTSGSTGLPKGAMVEHKGMLNHLFAKIHDLELTAADLIAQNASQCFDISIWQFLAALLVGGQVHIIKDEVIRDPAQLLEQVERERISILEIVPSMLRAILEELESSAARPASLAVRWLILTGEALPPVLCTRWLSLFPDIPMLNAYGPTECSDDVTHFPIYQPPSEDVVHVPIGRPIANMKLYVVTPNDSDFQLCPVGLSGELCVTGIGVGRGYVNDPQRTLAAFFKNPFSDNLDERLYRTGDLARYLPDGNIEFLGRIDRQVKIRGHRIELGEIESVLLRHHRVKACVVVAIGRRRQQAKLVARECLAQSEAGASAGEQMRLLAYVVCRDHASSSAIRSFLLEYLPPYMIPEQFIQLASLPLNSNGKVDVKALPEPENVRPESEEPFVEPRDALESLIASIWQDVFGIDRVGVNDSFFVLGGDSLLAVQVLSRLRRIANVNLSFVDLFNALTVAELARSIRQREAGTLTPLLAMRSSAHRERYPLSYAQQRMWFLWKLEPGNPYYTFQGTLFLRGRLDLALFERAWQKLFDRHVILKARFGEEDGRPYQIFDDSRKLALPLMDLSHLPGAERFPAVRTAAREEVERVFDLENDRLFRAHLFTLSEQEHVLLLTMHEIILDGWATCVMIRELGVLYDAMLKGEDFELLPVPVQFSDFVLWESENLDRPALKEQEQYWREELSGELPILDLPTDRPRPALPTYAGQSKGVLLDSHLTGQLYALSRQQDTTLFMTLLSAFYVILHAYTDQEDIIIGAPIANRDREDLEEIVGFFLNMLAFRVDLSGDPTFLELLGRVKENVTGAITNSNYPFIWLLEIVDAVRDTRFAPVFQVMFNMLSFPHVALQYEHLDLAFKELETGYTKYDLSLYAQEQGDQIYLQLSYPTDLFDEFTVDRLMKNFVVLLNSVVENPEAAISALYVLSKEEADVLLKDFNYPAMDYGNGLCIHELFELQAGKTPEQPALIFRGEYLSYSELNTRANQLANYMRRLGVGPEMLVAVCISRSLEMMVGLLGIVKAGGAYLPLDPDFPLPRLYEMLQDTAAPILLLQGSVDQFDKYEGRKIYIDEDWKLIESEDRSNPVCMSAPDNLLNVVYTSSTTGKPKGTLITIRSVLNRLFWMWHSYAFHPGDVAVLHKSFALVAATWECFGALLQGIPTLILSRDDLLDSQELWKKLVRHGVSYLLATPALLQGVIEQAESHSDEWRTLRLATTSAEPLSPALAARWKRRFPQSPLLNLYGSTECSSNATVYDTSTIPSDESRVPVGKPLANTKVYVLNEQLKPVPIGAVGEMCIAGECLARGYLNLAELTAARFIPDPFSDVAGARLYKTGDLARYRADGNIELVGRKDYQVKIRGFRVELEDIETSLSRCANVKRCAVKVYQDESDQSRLAAYVEGAGPVSAAALRSFLRARLPDYMVPSDFVVLEALPRTPAGKVDRRALLPPDRTRPEGLSAFAAPRTATEEMLSQIWSAVLGIERVGIYDNFFDLGGHSLLAMRVISRLRDALQVELPLRKIYDSPTVAGLAEAAEIASQKQRFIDAANQGAGEPESNWEMGEL
jgi:surfactin family lipopeptide synthetase A